MEKKSRLKAVDILLLILMLLPLVAGIFIKILLVPASEGMAVSGAYIFFTVPFAFGGIPITESQVNSWLVILTLLFFCLFLTRGLKVKAESARQHIAEYIVEKVEGLVNVNMGEYFYGFAPFICAILALSAFSSLVTLLGLYPPTSDINVVGGWALLVAFLITYFRMKCGPVIYLKSFASPVAFMFPLNLVSEVATPLSMAFRHYGNIVSGSLIAALVKVALGAVSKVIVGWLPGLLGDFPLFSVGLPAILSLYFDLFSGCLQAFIFAMLTMLYVSGAFPADDYEKRKEKRRQKMLAQNKQ